MGLHPSTTAEHTLELNTIGDFIPNLWNGGFPAVQLPDGQQIGPSPHSFVFGPNAVLNMFDTTALPEWRSHFPNIAPAELWLRYCGSVEYPQGMVVANSILNQLKTNVSHIPVLPPTDWVVCISRLLRE